MLYTHGLLDCCNCIMPSFTGRVFENREQIHIVLRKYAAGYYLVYLSSRSFWKIQDHKNESST